MAQPPAIHRVIGIQFSLFSPEEFKQASVVEVVTKDTYVREKPVVGGLFDPRMGVLEPGYVCPTDGLTYTDTPGYPGHITLARPVFFIQYLKDIVLLCRCICFKCSKLRIDKEAHRHILSLSPDERFSYVSKVAATVRRCGDNVEHGCGCKQPDKIEVEGMATIYAVWKGIDVPSATGQNEDQKIVVKLSPDMIAKLFRRIHDDDLWFLGFHPVFGRPEWMICSVLPVPPPAMRPSVKYDAQQRSEDDLTHIYGSILKTNKDLQEKMDRGAQPNVVESLTSVLQYFVAMIVNNKAKGAMPLAQRSGRPFQCLLSRINGKEGRIRNHLMGKRVDYSARSVITGDPHLSIRQLGVPLKIAKNLTRPIKVHKRNIGFLTRLVQHGPDVHPGAKILEKPNGDLIALRHVDREMMAARLEIGDIVHRHLLDGDAVLFNRQPSLHRPSMMCHLVKVLREGDSFRMNVGCTKPYNADFDGDEMNMHVPQSDMTEIELRELAAIPFQLISPANNAPIIGIFQDSLLGAFQLTRAPFKVEPRRAMNWLMGFAHVDPTRPLRTNFDLLSQLLPPISALSKTKLFDDTKDQWDDSNHILELKNGTYVRGQLEKSSLGSSSKGLLHRLNNEFGPMVASDFIDDLQNVVTAYLKEASFSVGISDLITDHDTKLQIQGKIAEKKQEVEATLALVHAGLFINETAQTNRQELETRVNNLLKQADNDTGKIARTALSESNRFLQIIQSGSKGNLINVTQMLACVGQQNIDGQRIPYSFDNRALPHFCKFDDSPAARGYVEHSYIDGLAPHEFVFHAACGRVGLIDTAVKSVTYDTLVAYSEGQGCVVQPIGEWIDELLLQYRARVQYFPNDRNLEIVELPSTVMMPTMDADGQAFWAEVTHVCRHDPGEVLYEVTTVSGRSVTVTASKSLVIWSRTLLQFSECTPESLSLGDALPVVYQLPLLPKQGVDEGGVDEGLDEVGGDKQRDFFCDYSVYEFLQDETRVNEALPHFTQEDHVKLSLLWARQGRLYPFCPTGDHVFERVNEHVLLDPIVSIVPVVPLEHEKVYDVTLPSTLNFMLANGLVVRDTSQTGYIQRRLIKSLEDLVACYDGTVRNSKGRIVQYVYGDDGFDPVHTEHQNLPLLQLSLEDVYLHLDLHDTKATHVYTKDTASRLHKQKEACLKRCKQAVDELVAAREALAENVFLYKNESSIKLPVNLPALIQTLHGQLGLSSNSTVDITPLETFELLDHCWAELETLVPFTPPTALFRVHFYYHLSPRLLLQQKRFHRQGLVWLLHKVQTHFLKAVVHPGEMVGVLAGQSIGEPTTQLTLNTFHYSGVASKTNVTRGVPRLEEILNLTKNPKKPSLTIFLKPVDEANRERAVQYATMIEHTKLQDIVEAVQLCFEQPGIDHDQDRLWMQEFELFERRLQSITSCTTTTTTTTTSPWILRLEMDRTLMLDKNITMDDVHFALTQQGRDMPCVFSDYNHESLVFRVRLPTDILAKKRNKNIVIDPMDQTDDICALRAFQEQLLDNTVLRGVDGIEKVTPRKLQGMVRKQQGKYEPYDCWVLDTQGSNLLSILAVDYIDATRTYSNDIQEVFQVLGIEGARQVLYNELVDVMESSGDVYINHHHVSLLCDRMTMTKNMVSVFRTGILNDNIGPIAKATFEVHTKILLDAARHAEMDPMRGVSANVMLGQLGLFGTNAFQILLDLPALVHVEGHQNKDDKEEEEQKEKEQKEKEKQEQNKSVAPQLPPLQTQNNIAHLQRVDVGHVDDDYTLM